MNKRKLTEFGFQVKNKLADKSMSQKELAEVLGTSPVYLSLIFYGERSGKKYISKIKEILEMD